MVRRVLLGLSCAFALTALALMLFGKGIAMRFSSGEGEYIVRRYNYLVTAIFLLLFVPLPQLLHWCFWSSCFGGENI